MNQDFKASQLHKAFRDASNQQQGAEMLLAHLLDLHSPTPLGAQPLARARAYCDQLGEVTAAAQKAYQAHTAPAFDITRPYTVAFIADAA